MGLCKFTPGGPSLRGGVTTPSALSVPSFLLGFSHLHIRLVLTQMVKSLPAMQETWFWSLGWEDPLEKGMATQYSGLENSMDCIVHGVTKSWTRLSNFHFHSYL